MLALLPVLGMQPGSGDSMSDYFPRLARLATLWGFTVDGTNGKYRFTTSDGVVSFTCPPPKDHKSYRDLRNRLVNLSMRVRHSAASGTPLPSTKVSEAASPSKKSKRYRIKSVAVECLSRVDGLSLRTVEWHTEKIPVSYDPEISNRNETNLHKGEGVIFRQ